jgi:4'-phosphopantetheinyl transferase
MPVHGILVGMSLNTELAAGEAHLLWCPAPAVNPGERHVQLDRMLRRALAPYVGQAAADLQFGREPRGRPFLLGVGAELSFSLSDTVGGSVVAVARGLRVGVDLERLDREPPVLRLARRYFDPLEAAALAALPDELQARAFLHAWTAKEAACKATGSGLQDRLHRWCFEIDPSSADPQLRCAPPEAGDPAAWSLRRLSPAPGYTAVVAAAGTIHALHMAELPRDPG